jgi:hypothetical protein
MITIKELFDIYGSVWLTPQPGHPDAAKFKPLCYSTDKKYIVGEFEETELGRIAACYRADYTGYVFYEKPKKKVIKYLFASLDDDNNQNILSGFFETEVKAKDFYQYKEPFKRLDWSATEFDE